MQEIVEVCSDIGATIKRLAKKHKIHPRKIDFEILGLNTFLIKGEELQKVSAQALYEIAYSPYEMRQFYKVRFFVRGKELEPFLFSIRSEEEGTKLIAAISLERLPALDEKFIPTLKHFLQKRMALGGYIWGLGGKRMEEEIARFFATLLKRSALKGGAVKLTLCELRIPEVIKPASLKLLSKPYGQGRLLEGSELLEGAILKVEAGEVILRYRKPTYKAAWRSCKGEWFGEGSYPIGIIKGEGLEQVENEENIEYKAQKEGFASILEGRLSVLEMPIIESLDFKRSKNLADLGIERLQILNEESSMDAIAQGVELEIPYLVVKGNVGPATIVSKELKINGQIHARASLSAEEATLLFLKGSLKASKAQVKFCESAHLVVEELKASYLGGTTAFFEEAEVERLGSNNTLHIGKSLRLKEVMGKGNVLAFDPFASKKSKRQLDWLNHQREFFEEVTRGGHWREREIHQERVRIKLFLEEIQSRQTLIEGMGEAVARELLKAQSSQELRLRRNERILEAMRHSKERLERLKEEINTLKERVLGITLECQEGIGEENTILFRLPSGESLEFIPPYPLGRVGLVKTEEGEYEVSYERLFKGAKPQGGGVS
ncbi:MAG: DUF342 domain-containing protein [Wolinella succinogenes]|uniref:hypothetical protein n=1 Tax=Wolinella succinogenes TaxID=844 RepID=UPI00169ACE2A|nr:hypothetical protein [Wolinella succinogenes]NLU33994.1 DUF342 domain-containing protein [Wolinella succinogenes]